MVTTINFSSLESEDEENDFNEEEAVGRKLYSKKGKRGYFVSRPTEKIALRKVVLDQVESRILSQFTPEQKLMFGDWKGLLGIMPPEETINNISERTGKKGVGEKTEEFSKT